MTVKKVFLGVVFSLLLGAPSFCAMSDSSLIDIPTAEVMPLHSLGVQARAFSEGGVLSYFDFSVLSRFSIGASFTFEHLIGTNDQKIKMLVPALQLKLRFYDGGEYVPALAVGFDNQGYWYDHDKDQYLQEARGVYLAASKELFTSGLLFNPGVNVTVDGFGFNKFAGFMGVSYTIEDTAGLLFEWDDIRGFDHSRLNTGVRVYITDFFAMDFALRDFNHKTERVAQVKYVCNL